MSQIDPEFYSNITQPSRTRNAAPPIHSFPLEKRRVTRNTIMDPYRRIYNTQGFSASNIRAADADAGKYYYIHIDSYDTSATTTDFINEVSPLIVNPSKYEPGAYYTFMIASVVGRDPDTNKTVLLSSSGAPELYVTKTINIYEFGTKHHHIMYRKANQDEALFAELSKTYKNVEYIIYAAGEIMCVNENTLIFNFISGTYKMKKHMTATRVKYERAYFTYMMHKIAPKYSTILFQQEALITEATMPLTRRELSRLRNRNVPFFMLNTQMKCNRMRNAIIQRKTNNLSHDELREIYNQLMKDTTYDDILIL
jgi:hypothetical protein